MLGYSICHLRSIGCKVIGWFDSKYVFVPPWTSGPIRKSVVGTVREWKVVICDFSGKRCKKRGSLGKKSEGLGKKIDSLGKKMKSLGQKC